SSAVLSRLPRCLQSVLRLRSRGPSRYRRIRNRLLPIRVKAFHQPHHPLHGPIHARPLRQSKEVEGCLMSVPWPTSADLRGAQNGSASWGTSDVPTHCVKLGTGRRSKKFDNWKCCSTKLRKPSQRARVALPEGRSHKAACEPKP